MHGPRACWETHILPALGWQSWHLHITAASIFSSHHSCTLLGTFFLPEHWVEPLGLFSVQVPTPYPAVGLCFWPSTWVPVPGCPGTQVLMHHVQKNSLLGLLELKQLMCHRHSKTNFYITVIFIFIIKMINVSNNHVSMKFNSRSLNDNVKSSFIYCQLINVNCKRWVMYGIMRCQQVIITD